ncbi:hypothetical protein LCGC14_1524050 [marine sediment metagenome]|uniref:Uncharacterized protein n=1 Tax=marine sediment metagenome TaxID=412755 RepID=A0A0F9IXZ2_9ZZZZ
MRTRADLQAWMREGCPITEPEPSAYNLGGPDHYRFSLRVLRDRGAVEVKCDRCEATGTGEEDSGFRPMRVVSGAQELVNGGTIKNAGPALGVACSWADRHSESYHGKAWRVINIGGVGREMQSWLQGGMLDETLLKDQPNDGYVFALDLSDSDHADVDEAVDMELSVPWQPASQVSSHSGANASPYITKKPPPPGRLPAPFTMSPGATASRAEMEMVSKLAQSLAQQEDDAFMGVKPKPTLHVPKRRGILGRAWDRVRGVKP